MLLAWACYLAGWIGAESSQPTALRVNNGTCKFVAPTPTPTSNYLVIVGNLGPASAGPQSIKVRAEPTTEPIHLPLANDNPGPAWRQKTTDVAQRQANARARAHFEIAYAAAEPSPRRTFHIFVGKHDFANAAAYATVQAHLRGVGKRCQVYVDQDYPSPANVQPTVEEIVRYFDTTVYPSARRDLGQCLDVDRDGRFTILLSALLKRMGDKQGRLDGFVRGCDLLREVAPPFGNQCDMLYLNADLRPGPQLRAVLAHEYAHAVVFSEHIFGDYFPETKKADEESWLDEGIAHVTEARLDARSPNLAHRVQTFLETPERYPLVVADYYGTGLWRNPGCRGASFTFLQSCAATHPGLLERLTRSNLTGITNLEGATREPFASLFRRWTVHIARGALSNRPRAYDLATSEQRVKIAGTAAAYFLLPKALERTRITVSGANDCQLQVTLVAVRVR